jgi:serine/threonine-protein kinase
VIKGKLAYLAPEQASGSALDPRTDLYAAGVVIWELVTGERWLDAATEIELLRLAEDPRFRAPSEIAGAPAALDAVLERALRRFPEERFASARAMHEALERIDESMGGDGRAELAALAVAAFPSGTETPAGGGAERSEARRSSALLGRALLAVLSVAVAVIGLRALMLTSESEAPAGVPAPAAMSADAASPRFSDAEVAEAGAFSTMHAFADATPTTRVIDASRPDVSGVRAPLSRVARRPDMSARASPADAGRTPADLRPARVRDRRDALAANLRARGIQRADLPPLLRTRLEELDRAIAASRWDDAMRLLDETEPAAAAVRVDATFVRQRLDRVGARIAAARRGGADTREIENAAATALQLFLDGRFDETNRRLGEIEARLR